VDERGELGLWLDGYGEFARELSVPGAYAPVYVTDSGVGVTATGMGPAHAAASVTACLATDRLDTDDAYLVTAGIAGVSPHAGTVGSVVLADHVVDWDAKLRAGAGERAEPWPFGPPRSYELDRGLVAAAERIAAGVELADSVAARRRRADYDAAPASDPPAVERGTTVAADIWHGHALAAQAESLVAEYDAGTYATTECEGFGTAVACDRFGVLDRYLSVRAASNFDRPPGGDADGDAAAATDVGGGHELDLEATAYTNAYRVGRAIADAVADDWDRWRDGPPDVE
jgi:purine nucleoside permease